MFRVARTALLLAIVASPALAQEPGAMGGRRFQPPPDHWMTIDSLADALTLTADQKTKVAQPHTALNGVMRDAAARRQAFRQQMQGTFVPGIEPTPKIRAQVDSMRVEMEGFQAEADQWLAAIRGLLTPAQQPKFDALQKPQLARRGPAR